jgi:hypothetical protein
MITFSLAVLSLLCWQNTPFSYAKGSILLLAYSPLDYNFTPPFSAMMIGVVKCSDLLPFLSFQEEGTAAIFRVPFPQYAHSTFSSTSYDVACSRLIA